MSNEHLKEDLVLSIRERYQHIQARIAEAAAGSRFAAKSIRLVVVSKSQPMDVIRAAIAANVTVLGENYVEEAVEKIATLKETGVEWHMIGHVQSRKAELVAKNFSMLHSLDNLKLAVRLDRFCSESKRILPVLLEFNVSGEESKFGFPAWDEQYWPELLAEIERILTLSHLHICGLMTMPPFFTDPEQTRPYFRRLRGLREYLEKNIPQADWSDLSMGTSVDFVAAVQEGATFVRIGQAILGSRPK